MRSVRTIAPRRRLIACMIRRIAGRGDEYPALCWYSGALAGHWRRGMQGPVDQSRFGKPGATMFKATRLTRAISSRKRVPNTRPKRWAAFSPLTRADRQHRSIGLTDLDDRFGSGAAIQTTTQSNFSWLRRVSVRSLGIWIAVDATRLPLNLASWSCNLEYRTCISL
jgi:hypothetical protein